MTCTVNDCHDKNFYVNENVKLSNVNIFKAFNVTASVINKKNKKSIKWKINNLSFRDSGNGFPNIVHVH